MAAIQVTIFSAKGLEYPPGHYGSDGPYTVIWVDPNNRFSTKVSEGPAARPYWNESLEIPWLDPVDGDTTLFIDIVHPSAGEDTVNVLGCARLNLRKVLHEAISGGNGFRSLTLKSPSGRRQGKVHVTVTVLGHSYPPPPPPVGYNQPSFWERLATRLAVGTISEMFQECFGGDYYDGFDYSIL